MTLVTLEKITRRFGEYPILDGLSLRIDEGDRIGVIGDNGAGKTTMVRILAGTDDADTGQRNCRKDLRIAYGAQMPKMPAGTTVLQLARHGTGEHQQLAARMRALEARMATGEEAALAEYGHLQAAFEAGGGYDHDHQVEKVLDGLGFDAGGRQKDVAVLSGGEQSRVQLAILMTTPADLLILDEPTNHLDLAGIEYVEDFVRRYPALRAAGPRGSDPVCPGPGTTASMPAPRPPPGLQESVWVEGPRHPARELPVAARLRSVAISVGHSLRHGVWPTLMATEPRGGDDGPCVVTRSSLAGCKTATCTPASSASSIPGKFRDVKLDVAGGEVRVTVAAKSGARLTCPECGEACPRHDARERSWRHLDTCQFKTILVADVARVNRAEHGVKQVRVPWAEPGSGFTALMEAVVIDWLRSLASIKAVAEQLRLSWDQVDGIMARAVTRGLLRRKNVCVRSLGVDETSFQRRHEYVTIVTDLDGGVVLHVADDRKRESLDAFFCSLTEEQLAAIESIAMDMWSPFISSASEHVPDADRKIAFDKFHVAGHLGEAVDRVRRHEHKALLALGDDSLKGSRYLWLTNPDNLDAAGTGSRLMNSTQLAATISTMLLCTVAVAQNPDLPASGTYTWERNDGSLSR
ncbi:MAG: ISL3 family transposase [Planctomycetota bacterium]